MTRSGDIPNAGDGDEHIAARPRRGLTKGTSVCRAQCESEERRLIAALDALIAEFVRQELRRAKDEHT